MQRDLNISRKNYLDVIYKDEREFKDDFEIILWIIPFTICFVFVMHLLSINTYRFNDPHSAKLVKTGEIVTRFKYN